MIPSNPKELASEIRLRVLELNDLARQAAAMEVIVEYDTRPHSIIEDVGNPVLMVNIRQDV